MISAKDPYGAGERVNRALQEIEFDSNAQKRCTFFPAGLATPYMIPCSYIAQKVCSGRVKPPLFGHRVQSLT